MNYGMTEPCDACPFLKRSGFTFASLTRHASGVFACHKACVLEDREDGNGEAYHARNAKTPHCAGALIFLEKQGAPHQMMRIAERLGMYDRTKLNMSVDVGSKPRDYRRATKRERENV